MARTHKRVLHTTTRRAPLDRWDVGEAPPGGVAFPWLADHWACYLEDYYLGVRKLQTPQFGGTLWAGVFDLRWQFVAAHEYVWKLPDAHRWHIPGVLWHRGCLREWEVLHREDKHALAGGRGAALESARWFAGEILQHPHYMERLIYQTPLGTMLPEEAWEPVLTGLVRGGGPTPEERVMGLVWGLFRMGIQWPQKPCRSVDIDDVLVGCNRALLVARQAGGREYRDLPDPWGEDETAEVPGEPEDRQAGWLEEVGRLLVRPEYRVWL